MTEEEKKVYNQYRTILDYIQPPNNKDGIAYKASDYYGTGYYQQKKDNKYSFYLIYDYVGRNQLKSNTIVLDSLDELFKYIAIMDKFKVNKATKIELKLNLDEVKDYAIEEEKSKVDVKRNTPSIFA